MSSARQSSIIAFRVRSVSVSRTTSRSSILSFFCILAMLTMARYLATLAEACSSGVKRTRLRVPRVLACCARGLSTADVTSSDSSIHRPFLPPHRAVLMGVLRLLPALCFSLVLAAPSRAAHASVDGDDDDPSSSYASFVPCLLWVLFFLACFLAGALEAALLRRGACKPYL